MRRLHSPTLDQWGCAHYWKTTTTRPGQHNTVRVRYLTCRRCGLRVKTEERLAVPWSMRDLVTLVKALLPEGQPVYLRDKGITELPLIGLNTLLERQGYIIHASKAREAKRSVACMGKDGRVEMFGPFELRRIPLEAPGATLGPWRREK